jgi:hypothetical protein
VPPDHRPIPEVGEEIATRDEEAPVERARLKDLRRIVTRNDKLA